KYVCFVITLELNARTFEVSILMHRVFSQVVDSESASELLAALAHPVRLEVFRELMAHGANGVSAGNLALAVELAPNALSFHLNRLKQAGLVSAQRAGQQTIYRAGLNTMRELVSYLDATCCNEVAGGCGPQCPPKPTTPKENGS
ncbi:hypothetical protein LCGC14_1362850, partial [marine sediment metagenome]